MPDTDARCLVQLQADARGLVQLQADARSLVQLQAQPWQPWRNGGGRTRELLAWPAGADWKVRVSVAEIAQDGPFSSFSGVQRWFAVLEGAGVRLTFDGAEKTLRPQQPPLAFDGRRPPHARLVDGPTLDLNLMVRDGLGLMIATRPGDPLPAGGLVWRAIYAHEAVRLQIGEEPPQVLSAGSLLASAAEDEPAWQVLDGSRAFWLARMR